MLIISIAINVILLLLLLKTRGKFVGYANIYNKHYGLCMSSVPKATRNLSEVIISGKIDDFVGVGEIYVKNIQDPKSFSLEVLRKRSKGERRY